MEQSNQEKQTGKNNIPQWEQYFGPELKKFDHIRTDAFSQLVVHTKPNFDEESLSKLAEQLKSFGEVQLGSLCGSCDRDLALLTGDGVKNFIQTETAPGGSQNSGRPQTETAPGGSSGRGGGPTGETDDVIYSYNAKMHLYKHEYEPIKESSDLLPFQIDKYQFKKIVNVAVFDTGVDPGPVTGYFYQSNPGNPPCIRGAEEGWDFSDNTNSFGDDFPSRHGTIVSRLIIDQAIKYHQNPVHILPVKIHNKKGESDLYSVLCGMAYAKERGVQIINASFGFYSPRNPLMSLIEKTRIKLLRLYIEEYLAKNEILLIAAAGNRDNEYYDDDYRDLDYCSFYPASFARHFKNVFAVTTSNKDTVSPTQNYSPSVVDAGVIADTENFEFINPTDTGTAIIKGSSFAAPILTGKIASHYSLIKQKLNGRLFNKENIIDVLANDLKLAKYIGSLADQIRDGLVIHK